MARWFVIIFAATLAFPALAVVLRHDNTVTVAKSEVIADDLVVSGGTLLMQGTVTGDLVVAAGTVEVDGLVRGDLIVAGGNVTVRGTVGGSLYLAGGNIGLAAKVGRNALITGGTLRLENGATVGRDLAVSGGNVTIAGKISRDLNASTGTLVLTDTARVGRNLQAWTRNPNIAAGAVIVGTRSVGQPAPRGRHHRLGWIGWAFWRVMMGLALFIAGLVFIAVAPRFTEETQLTLRAHPWASLLTGLIILIVTPLAVLIVMATVIGIPLALIALWIYGTALFLSPIVLAIFVGRAILRRRTDALYLSLLIGVVLFILVRLIPILGGLVAFIALLLGLGAFFLTWQARSTHPLYPPVPPVESQPSETPAR
ncbi:MAG TPA: hypothetical protein VGL77_17395 [Armatimonadota bacterium]|jgi:hypothetical protein